MNEHAWLLPCLFAAGIAGLFAVIIAAAVAGIWWLNRSQSPAAIRLRRRFATESNKPAAKRFFWTGEDVAYRKQAARDFAGKRRLSFEENGASLVPLLQTFPKLGLLSPRAEVGDVIRWERNGRTFSLASYTHIGLEDPTTETVLYVDVSDLRLPPFFITDKKVVHTFRYSMPALEFSDDAEFSSRFHLESRDEAAARKVFDREARRQFVAVGACRIECTESKLLFSDWQYTTVAAYEIFVDESMRLLDAITRPSP